MDFDPKQIEVIASLIGKDKENELNNQLRSLAVLVNRTKEEAESNNEVRDDFFHLIPSVSSKKKRCFGLIGLITSRYLAIFEKEKRFKLHLRIPFQEIVFVHPLSKMMKVSEGKKLHGVFLGCVSVKFKKHFTFQFVTPNERDEKRFVLVLQQLSFLGELKEGFTGLDHSKRRLLIIINPASGQATGAKKSPSIFENEIKPIFNLCHFQYKIFTTRYAGHATEICQRFDPEKYTEIVSMGGDGILHEIVQGLFKHPRIRYDEVKKIPIFIIPSGTGNALAWDMLNGSPDPVIGALVCARGKTIPYDIMSILTPKERYFSFLFFAYGAIPDVEFGYQMIHWLGDFKYVLAGIHKCVSRTCYDVDCEFVKYQDDTKLGTPLDPYEFPKEFSNRFLVGGDVKIRVLSDSDDPNPGPPLSLLEKHFSDDLKTILKHHKIQKPKPEEEEEEEEEGEEEEEEPIIIKKRIQEKVFLFVIANSRKFSYDIWSAGNHNSGIGALDLFYAGKVGVLQALSSFKKMMSSKGPEHLDDAEVFPSERILAWKFRPKGPKFSLMDVDGEFKEREDMFLGMVHKRLITLGHIEKKEK